MLKALYDYAIRNKLALPPGFVNKTVKAYILLSAEGNFIGIEPGGTVEVPAPDIGSLANGKDKSNVLLEKRSIIIPEKGSLKNAFFLKTLRDGGIYEPKLAICADVLEDREKTEQIRLRLNELKIKDGDRITFRVDGRSVLESEAVTRWWQDYRLQFSTEKEKKNLCLITGELTKPMETTTPIAGLKVVGGHARGDALICFDKNSFCSYDLKKAANAPVSEEAFAGVKAALDSLLKHAPTLAGMKFVHWYDYNIPEEYDPFWNNDMFQNMVGEAGDTDQPSQPEADKETEQNAKIQADKLINSVESGEYVPSFDDVHYYILLLSGVGGRIMIRRYERGNYAELRNKIEEWRSDLSLVNPDGRDLISSCKLVSRLMKLMSFQKEDRNPFDRMAKELSGLAPAILTSILTGSVLPDTVAVHTLAFIRSDMMASDNEEDALFKKDVHVWQWLKVWLLRSRGKRGLIMEAYNPEYQSIAYQCGAMLSVYEAIQKEAMPNVNTTVVQRYYSSAIQTPALVLGRLSQLSRPHLEKMENQWLANQFREKLMDIAVMIHGKIPAVLTLEQQSEFALGYYQMWAEMKREKDERVKAKKEAAAVSAAND